jgi:hypothetical protein
MAALGEKSFCVLQYRTSKSVVTVQRAFHAKYAKDFFLWGYVKDRVCIPSLPRDLPNLKARIIAAGKNIVTPILTRVWQELEYRIDACRVTRGAQIDNI